MFLFIAFILIVIGAILRNHVSEKYQYLFGYTVGSIVIFLICTQNYFFS